MGTGARRFTGRLARRPGAVLLSAVLAVTVLDGALAAAPAQAAPTPSAEDAQPYLVGRGIGEVTGEAADAGMLGYADLEQTTAGIHQRLRARTFIVVDRASNKRLLHSTVEAGLMFQSVREEVLRRLGERFPGEFGEDNVLLTVTHTHSAGGGTAGHGLYNVTTLGYRPKTFEAQVAGIVDSAVKAHDDLRPAQLSVSRDQLTGTSANRTKVAFDRNPAEDKAHFPDGIDPTSTTLQVTRDGRVDGAINWFPVHGTSMSTQNRLISPDNKGYAAYQYEHDHAGVDYLGGDDPAFVAAFAQSNSGDMSPNLDLHEAEGEQQFTSSQAVGARQSASAQAQVASSASAAPLSGGLDTRTVYVDLSNVEVRPEFTGDGATHRTCSPILGAAFAAGSTEDGGGGVALFKEGQYGGNPVPAALSTVLYNLDPALGDCQGPKELLLPVGLVDNAVQTVLPVQLVRIGDFYLVAMPTEVTVVAGLRLRQQVAAAVGTSLDNVLVQGYSNAYAHYLTTPEEYDTQNYEGASTMFGRWQLPALEQTVSGLATAMAAGEPVSTGGPKPDLGANQLVSPAGQVLFDTTAVGFGTVLTQPAASYAPGERATTVFSGANPNNNLRRGGTFLTVERQDGDGWTRVADDGDWSTRFGYAHDGLTGSVVTITWDVPAAAAPGTYRITYSGDAKNPWGAITPFTGTSRPFTVTG
ncbi:neutral/alkaline ceramidase [Rhodococcus sp. X156]|uniref:neutral/alkaline ceramidase n=1 Tax=Rhodococcus sp. X156 TaxID=2499145 RepID=UPI000FDA7019|nr:neutral/alkaline ceramidase [Rhodococcus sp. X156]